MLQGASTVVFFLFCWQLMAFGARTFLASEGVCNTGGPFGIVLPLWLLWGALALAVSFLVRGWWQHEERPSAFVWLLLLSAGASNILERLHFGCVFDYIALPFLPLFNGADVILTVSVVCLLWREIRYQRS
jgi:lipoprotein signal peptidase